MIIQNIFINAGSRFYELLTIPARNPDVLWTIVPLLIATVIMFVYFQKYKEEELGWNSAVANSLVAVFVSVSLLRHVYFITSPGSILNFTQYLSKTIFSLLLFFTAFILLVVNFSHVLPKKVAYYASSPLTINLISYVVIIFVYSNIPFDLVTFFILLIVFAVFRMLLYLVQFPLVKLFKHLKRLKEQEEIKDVQKEQKKIEGEKKEIKKKEKKIKKTKIKELEHKEKQIQRVKKVIAKK